MANVNLVPVHRRKDDNGHMYLVPVEYIEEFDAALEKGYEGDDYDEFFEKGFERFMHGGSDYDVIYYVDPKTINDDHI